MHVSRIVAFLFFAIAAIVASSPAAAIALGGCEISADRLSITVTASNDEAKSYACQATCKARVENQRAFEVVTCRWSASPNMAEKQVCKVTAKSGGKFTEIANSNAICSPR